VGLQRPLVFRRNDAVRGGEIERQLEERRNRLGMKGGAGDGGATAAGGSSSSSSS